MKIDKSARKKIALRLLKDAYEERHKANLREHQTLAYDVHAKLINSKPDVEKLKKPWVTREAHSFRVVDGSVYLFNIRGLASDVTPGLRRQFGFTQAFYTELIDAPRKIVLPTNNNPVFDRALPQKTRDAYVKNRQDQEALMREIDHTATQIFASFGNTISVDVLCKRWPEIEDVVRDVCNQPSLPTPQTAKLNETLGL